MPYEMQESGNDAIKNIHNLIEVMAEAGDDDAQIYMGYVETVEDILDKYFFLNNLIQAVADDLTDMEEDYGVEKFGEWSEKLKDLANICDA